MAGGGRTYYATGTGRFSKGKEIRAHEAEVNEATRKGELRIKTSFGPTTKAPQGTLSKEDLLKVLRSGDTIKFGDGTSVKINEANKLATVNRLVAEGQRQITPAPAQTRPVVGGQFRGKPTQAPKPAPTKNPKPAPTKNPKPNPTKNPTSPKPAPKPAPTKNPKQNPTKNPTAPAKKGGKDGGKTRGSGSRKKGAGLIASAGVINTGNRRKGGGGKKDRKRGVKKRKGGRSGRGRSK